MFKNILFATAASPACGAAAKVAFELAQKYHARLWIVHVLQPSPDWPGQKPADSQAGDQAWLKEEVRQTYLPLSQSCVQPEIRVLSGEASECLLDFSTRHLIDCIIMGAHTRGQKTGLVRHRDIAGLTLQAVAASTGIPVLVISRTCDTCFWYFNRIIFGTDFSENADAAFQFAFKMAESIGSRLTLFHAPDIMVSKAGIAPGQQVIEDQIQNATTEIESRYVSQMGDFDNYEVIVWEGVPHVELLKYARINSADLIVMGHHTEETDLTPNLFGTTVEQVILRSACPVATINPLPYHAPVS